MTYILVFWFNVSGMAKANIPATAEFNDAAACTGAIFALQDHGFTGICLPKGEIKCR